MYNIASLQWGAHKKNFIYLFDYLPYEAYCKVRNDLEFACMNKKKLKLSKFIFQEKNC